MNELVGIGVIGYGYWGPNLVRNFANSEVARVVSVSDLDPSKLAICRRLYPSVETTSDFRNLLDDPRIEAIAIAHPSTPTMSLRSLRSGPESTCSLRNRWRRPPSRRFV
jgi:hypothetical protein